MTESDWNSGKYKLCGTDQETDQMAANCQEYKEHVNPDTYQIKPQKSAQTGEGHHATHMTTAKHQAKPGIWIALGAVFVFIAGALVWFFGFKKKREIDEGPVMEDVVALLSEREFGGGKKLQEKPKPKFQAFKRFKERQNQLPETGSSEEFEPYLTEAEIQKIEPIVSRSSTKTPESRQSIEIITEESSKLPTPEPPKWDKNMLQIEYLDPDVAAPFESSASVERIKKYAKEHRIIVPQTIPSIKPMSRQKKAEKKQAPVVQVTEPLIAGSQGRDLNQQIWEAQLKQAQEAQDLREAEENKKLEDALRKSGYTERDLAQLRASKLQAAKPYQFQNVGFGSGPVQPKKKKGWYNWLTGKK